MRMTFLERDSGINEDSMYCNIMHMSKNCMILSFSGLRVAKLLEYFDFNELCLCLRCKSCQIQSESTDRRANSPLFQLTANSLR